MNASGRKIRALSPARRAALETLEQVAGGAYAADELLKFGDSITPRDAALASQIVFGVLRFQLQLDYLVQMYSGRAAEDLDLAVQVALRAAIYQLRYLDRIPSHAAVNESVEWVKIHKRAASGLVNAVLRKVNRKLVSWPSPHVETSCPEWLLDSWSVQFGQPAARGIAEAALREPGQYVRMSKGEPVAEGWLATDVPGCFRVPGPAPDGMRLQDIGSQAIVPLLELGAGQTYLDLCAAPGNKTVQALETALGLAVACDVSLQRLRHVLATCHRVVLDATVPLPFRGRFERVFVDAPCSGTGTVGRNPEIKWRLRQSDLARFQERQVQIVLRGLEALAPGGRLVYATCSLEREENQDVVAEALRRMPERRLERELWRLPGREEGDGFYAAAIA